MPTLSGTAIALTLLEITGNKVPRADVKKMIKIAATRRPGVGRKSQHFSFFYLRRARTRGKGREVTDRVDRYK